MGYSQTKYPYVDTNLFDINFTLGYISRDDVFVYVTGELDGEGKQIFRDYDWVTDSRIRVIGELTVGDEVVLQRVVSKQNLIANFKDGTLDREALQNSFTQTMMALHELFDNVISDNVVVFETPAEIDAALTFIVENSNAIINVGALTAEDLTALSASLDVAASTALAAQTAAETARDEAQTSASEASADSAAAEVARIAAETAAANSLAPRMIVTESGNVQSIDGADGLVTDVLATNKVLPAGKWRVSVDVQAKQTGTENLSAKVLMSVRVVLSGTSTQVPNSPSDLMTFEMVLAENAIGHGQVFTIIDIPSDTALDFSMSYRITDLAGSLTLSATDTADVSHRDIYTYPLVQVD